jgi:hypothetical protein
MSPGGPDARTSMKPHDPIMMQVDIVIINAT